MVRRAYENTVQSRRPASGPSASRTLLRPLLLTLVCGSIAFASYVGIPYYRGQQAYQQAKQALADNKLYVARRLLSAYCKDWPRDPDGYFLAARAARRLREFSEAEAHLKECRNLGFDAAKL